MALETSRQGGAYARLTLLFSTIAASVLLVACDDTDTPASAPATLTCDDTMKTAFKPDANTTVLLVKAFKAGDPLRLSGTPLASDPVAPKDMCFVKLVVGPGNSGPASAPSTSVGIGIEVWLPTPANWNSRIHVQGGGGWAGGPQTTLTSLALSTATLSPWAIAGVEGAVSATTDTGHAGSDGSFAMNPDGTINQAGWNDFSVRGIHEMAVKTKALTLAYYGSDAKYSYWHAGSTGGRQGLKLAQAYPTDFNGIIANRPAVNWSKFTTSELYPQLVQQRDLGGTLLTAAQMTSVSQAAINACDLVGGQHLGYLLDPRQCTYDPTKDAGVLCTANGGTNATAACVSIVQANAFNKMWYGPTADGSVPAPGADNGLSKTLTGNQWWYGLTRGTNLTFLGGATPFTVSSDMVALELQDPTWATTSFQNATGNGQNRWKTLSYADHMNAMVRGVALQGPFGNIDTDSADLAAFKAAGGKLITAYGWSDYLIPPGGFINYYERVAAAQGGFAATQSFFRLFMVPGHGHGSATNGTANPNANPPLPNEDQLYAALKEWVENGNAPNQLILSTVSTATFPIVKSMPICPYPQNPTFSSGDITQASSYKCS